MKYDSRLSRIRFIRKISNIKTASIDGELDIFQLAEKDVPFSVSWIKKIWDDQALASADSHHGWGDEPHHYVLSETFFESMFLSESLDYKPDSSGVNTDNLDKFISNNWKFLYEISNDEGVGSESDIKLLGTGYFGKVFELPSNNILKISQNSYHEFMSDDNEELEKPYSKRIEDKKQDYRTTELGQKYLPIILDNYEIELRDGAFIYATLMKKVETFNNEDDILQTASTPISTIITRITKNVYQNVILFLNRYVNNITENFCEVTQTKHYMKNYIENMIFDSKSLPSLSIEFGADIHKYSSKWDSGIDWLIQTLSDARDGLGDEESFIKIEISDDIASNLEKFLLENKWAKIEQKLKDDVANSTKIQVDNNEFLDQLISEINSSVGRKLKEDWVDVLVSSIVDSFIKGNADISLNNVGIDSRGYLVFFDA
jgi:hypothetical protein